jgi:hypothetical protein
LCYPNLSTTASHKLSPRSIVCVFLGYPASHRGYRCLDLSTRCIITSRHVIFDETTFPFAQDNPQPTTGSFNFLLDLAATETPPYSAAPAPSSCALSSVPPCTTLARMPTPEPASSPPAPDSPTPSPSALPPPSAGPPP